MSVARVTLIFMIIDCDSCSVRAIACTDCVVSVLLSITAFGEQTEISSEGVGALGVLADRGLVPPLRFVHEA
jgi:hypothetical protein